MSEKSEKLYDGITHIREELLEQRVQKTRKPSWKRWGIRGAAAVLALVFVLGVLLKPEGSSMAEPGGSSMVEPGGSNITDPGSGGMAEPGGSGVLLSAYSIAEAEYPGMAQYPLDGASDSYNAWRKSVNAQRQPEGYANGMENYFTETVRQFLSGTGEGNRVYSPLNVYMALAMLAEVTDGSSRQQILDLLGSGSVEELRKRAASVWNAQYRNDGIVTRIMAGSLWLRDDMEYVQATMDTLAETYRASSYRGEMGTAEFNQALQEWLNEQTGGLLKEQAEEMELDPRTVLAIASTVYYKATWGQKFSESRNTQDVFHAVGGDVTCDFMHSSSGNLYYWGERFTAIRRGMEADGGSMWFLLPDEGYTPDDLLADDETLDFMLGGFSDWENQKFLMVNQSIPKFDAVSQLDLRAGLQALGITDVFDVSVSDFTPMVPDRSDVYLGKAQHDARVIIDEEGVEAAAYTVLAAPGAGMPPTDEIDFVVDRPFLFVITGADSLPLFAGVVNHP